jgi:hypothetical protein
MSNEKSLIAELYLRPSTPKPASIVKMVIRSTLAIIKDSDTGKRDKENSRQLAVLILCGLLEAGLPVPKDLAKFCATYIPKQLKKDKRGAKPKHQSTNVFDSYLQFINDGHTDIQAKSKVSKLHNQYGTFDETTLPKSIEREKKFLAFMKSINNVE